MLRRAVSSVSAGRVVSLSARFPLRAALLRPVCAPSLSPVAAWAGRAGQRRGWLEAAGPRDPNAGPQIPLRSRPTTWQTASVRTSDGRMSSAFARVVRANELFTVKSEETLKPYGFVRWGGTVQRLSMGKVKAHRAALTVLQEYHMSPDNIKLDAAGELCSLSIPTKHIPAEDVLKDINDALAGTSRGDIVASVCLHLEASRGSTDPARTAVQQTVQLLDKNRVHPHTDLFSYLCRALRAASHGEACPQLLGIAQHVLRGGSSTLPLDAQMALLLDQLRAAALSEVGGPEVAKQADELLRSKFTKLILSRQPVGINACGSLMGFYAGTAYASGKSEDLKQARDIFDRAVADHPTETFRKFKEFRDARNMMLKLEKDFAKADKKAQTAAAKAAAKQSQPAAAEEADVVQPKPKVKKAKKKAEPEPEPEPEEQQPEAEEPPKEEAKHEEEELPKPKRKQRKSKDKPAAESNEETPVKTVKKARRQSTEE